MLARRGVLWRDPFRVASARSFRYLSSTLACALAVACASPTAPRQEVPSTPAALTVVAFTAAVDSVGSTVYHTSLTVKETGGTTGATISSIHYTVGSDTGPFTVTRVPAVSRVPAGGSADLGPFDLTAPPGATAALVSVSVTFVDDSGHGGALAGTATVSKPTPPPLVLFSVKGLVTDATSGGVLPNILVQITDGPNAGWSAQTDSGGNYTLTGLLAGTFTIAASSSAYQTTTRSVNVVADTRVDLVLPRARPVPIPTNFTGSWEGTAMDSQGAMFITWALTQTGSSISGTVNTRAVHPDDGSCSACHRSKSGTISGSISGDVVTLSMFFAAGGSGNPTPICSASFSGSAASYAEGTLIASYSGSDTCEGLFSDGTLPMSRH